MGSGSPSKRVLLATAVGVAGRHRSVAARDQRLVRPVHSLCSEMAQRWQNAASSRGTAHRGLAMRGMPGTDWVRHGAISQDGIAMLANAEA